MSAARPKEAPRTKEAKKEPNPLMRYFKVLGPGLITGAADDDPSGIVTYSQAGSSFGFAPLWTVLVTFPLMSAVQYICSKIGLVTGRGLTSVLKDRFPRIVIIMSVILLFVANILNAAADLGAIASACHLLAPSVSEHIYLAVATVAIAVTMIFGSYKKLASIFKWLALSLFAYIGVAFFTHPNWVDIAKFTVIPHIEWNRKYIEMMVAILGTTISPYLFFWQSCLEVEEERSEGYNLKDRQGATKDDKKYALIDIVSGCLFSNIVMFFIIVATGATLGKEHAGNIESAAQAASALKPFAGEFAYVLFATAIISTGLLAVPVLVGSGAFAIAETCSWTHGLNKSPRKAKEFYFAIALSCAVAFFIDLMKVDPMKALYWSAIVNGILAPPILVLIMIVSNDKKIMLGHTNSMVTNILGWITTALMFAGVISLIFVQ